MVEKVDRPETRRPYQIREAKETKEDQHHQPDQREEAEKHYKKQLEGDQEEWNKFGRRSTVIKPVKIPCARIERILFRAINLYKGVGILQIDIIWKDGRKTLGALIRVGKMENFLRLKKFKADDEVPRQFWERGPTLEVGILQAISSSGPFPTQPAKDVKKQETRRSGYHLDLLALTGIVNRGAGRINWGVVAFYVFIIAAIVLGLYFETG